MTYVFAFTASLFLLTVGGWMTRRALCQKLAEMNDVAMDDANAYRRMGYNEDADAAVTRAALLLDIRDRVKEWRW
jgi:hypothetical protein